jgi:hypothetical protein
MRRGTLLLLVATAVLSMDAASSTERPAPSHTRKPRRGGRSMRPADRRKEASDQNATAIIPRLRRTVRELRQAMRSLLQPITPVGGFNMAADEGAREALIDYLWAGNYEDSVSEMSNANPYLHDRLVANTHNSSYSPSAAQDWRAGRRLNFLTGLLTRNRNVHVMPKDQALLALQAKVHRHTASASQLSTPAQAAVCAAVARARSAQEHERGAVGKLDLAACAARHQLDKRLGDGRTAAQPGRTI